MKKIIFLLILFCLESSSYAFEERQFYYPSKGCGVNKYENGVLSYANDQDFENMELTVKVLKKTPNLAAFRYEGEVYVTDVKCLRPSNSSSLGEIENIHLEESGSKGIMSTPATNGGRWRFGLGLAYAGAGKVKWEKDGESLELELDSSEVIGIEARKMARNSWGMIVGYAHEGDRIVKSATISISGLSLTVKGNSDSAKFGTSYIYYNAAYLWRYFYIPFGLNYSSVKFTPASGYKSYFTFSGALGAQLGVGYYLNDTVCIELMSRAIGMGLKYEDKTSNETIEPDNGYLGTGELSLKVFF